MVRIPKINPIIAIVDNAIVGQSVVLTVIEVDSVSTISNGIVSKDAI